MCILVYGQANLKITWMQTDMKSLLLTKWAMAAVDEDIVFTVSINEYVYINLSVIVIFWVFVFVLVNIASQFRN